MYAYTELNSDGYVKKVREKKVISGHAIAGAYCFKQGKDFISLAIEILISCLRPKGEFYMSNVFDYMVQKDFMVGIHEVNRDRVRCVGTPEQLKAQIKNDTLCSNRKA